MKTKNAEIGGTDGRRLALAGQLESEAMETFDLYDDGRPRAGLMLLASRVISEMHEELLSARQAIASQPTPAVDVGVDVGEDITPADVGLSARKPRKAPCPLDVKRGRHTYGDPVRGVATCACGATKGKGETAPGLPFLPDLHAAIAGAQP